MWSEVRTHIAVYIGASSRVPTICRSMLWGLQFTGPSTGISRGLSDSSL